MKSVAPFDVDPPADVYITTATKELTTYCTMNSGTNTFEESPQRIMSAKQTTSANTSAEHFHSTTTVIAFKQLGLMVVDECSEVR